MEITPLGPDDPIGIPLPPEWMMIGEPLILAGFLATDYSDERDLIDEINVHFELQGATVRGIEVTALGITDNGLRMYFATIAIERN